jgi:hypothetical protein
VVWQDLGYALAGALAAAVLVFLIGTALRLRARYWNPALRVALWSLVFGTAGYIWYALGLPGSEYLEDLDPMVRGLAIGFACGLIPLVAVVWMAIRRPNGR